MTNKEAIETIKIAMAEVEWNYPMDYTVAFEMAADALEKQAEYRNRIKSLINTIEDICKVCRERHTDDEHCGLCEYDGAYIGESGEWYNECRGFINDDCFELSKEFRNKYIDWSDEE